MSRERGTLGSQDVATAEVKKVSKWGTQALQLTAHHEMEGRARVQPEGLDLRRCRM